MSEELGDLNVRIQVTANGIPDAEVRQRITSYLQSAVEDYNNQQALLSRCIAVLGNLPFSYNTIEQSIYSCCVELNITLADFCRLASEGRIETRIQHIPPSPTGMLLSHDPLLRFVVRPWMPPSLESHYQALDSEGLRRTATNATCNGCTNY